MSYPVTHPVEVGTFGRFKHGGKKLIETWIALEEISWKEEMWNGIYSARYLVDFDKNYGLLTTAEISMFEGAL